LSPSKISVNTRTVFNRSEVRTCLFTSESVSEGHPDKLADRISDTILDSFLEKDPRAKVACETFIADKLVVVAGDQGLVFGYATNETPEMLPLPVFLAHQLVQQQATLRKDSSIPWLKPDAKSQVTVRYHNDKPVAVETVVFSAQHAENVSVETVRAVVEEKIVTAVIPRHLRQTGFRVLVNPAGRFVTGGPDRKKDHR
jgi:S-adenosylmethionine synthetase